MEADVVWIYHVCFEPLPFFHCSHLPIFFLVLNWIEKGGGIYGGSKTKKPFLILVQSHSSIALDKVEIDLVAQQVTNVGDGVLDHSGPLQTETEAVDPEIPGQTHALEHLGAEHARVANLDPLGEALVEAKDLHRGLGVGVVGGLEAQVEDAEFCEKGLEEGHEAAEGQVVVCDDALDLVELCEMGGVDGLVAEDAVDGEVAAGARVGGQAVQAVCRDGGGVGAQDQALGLCVGEGVAVADGAVLAVLVGFAHIGVVLGVVELGRVVCGFCGGVVEGGV